jgi:hypothetical protein
MFVDASRRAVGWRGAASLLVAMVLTLILEVAPARSEDLAERFGRAADGAGVTVDHAAFAGLLRTYAAAGPDGVVRVDYGAFKERGQAALKTYIAQLASVDVSTLNSREQFAFWANLYNAKTLDIVLDHYPVPSIKDISLGGGVVAALTGGPWKAKVVTVGGLALSLDDIEHGLMRPVSKDPRVHYAVNCASIGCPNLPLAPFTGALLEEQLDAAARAFVNHPRGVSVEGADVIVSSIYHWYKADFGGNDAGLLAHLRRFADPPLRAKLKSASQIADHRYDWSLNDLRAAR